jgi:hypothetical protein
VKREHHLALLSRQSSGQSAFPVAIFFRGWDRSHLDCEWWNEFYSEFLTWNPQRRWNLTIPLVLVATEEQLWCEPEEFGINAWFGPGPLSLLRVAVMTQGSTGATSNEQPAGQMPEQALLLAHRFRSIRGPPCWLDVVMAICFNLARLERGDKELRP